MTRRATDGGTLLGIAPGFTVNLYLWLFAPNVSWLWWNVIGCVATFGVGYLASLATVQVNIEDIKNLIWSRTTATGIAGRRIWSVYYALLVAWFVVMIVIMAVF